MISFELGDLLWTTGVAVVAAAAVWLWFRSQRVTPKIPLKGLPVKPTLQVLFRPEDASVSSDIQHSFELPDSFAPLLSSSHTEVRSLSTDFLHGLEAKVTLQLAPGTHDIPLQQPPLQLQVPKQGCTVQASAWLGSDGWSLEQDCDTHTLAPRTQTLVQQAQLTLDPPLSLDHVAPTLVHIPTVFESSHRRVTLWTQLLQSSARALWMLEQHCRISLSSIHVVRRHDRLSLRFSGHVLLLQLVPIPFFQVVLPHWILPQPHALLEQLCTNQPLVATTVRHERLDVPQLVRALAQVPQQVQGSVRAVVTPPELGIDWTLPGGLTLLLHIGLGRCSTENNKPDERLHSPEPSLASTTSSKPALPWSVNVAFKASVSQNKVSVRLTRCQAHHDESGSHVGVKGSLAIWKANPMASPLRRQRSFGSAAARPALMEPSDELSVATLLLFPDDAPSSLLHYDYALDVEDSRMDVATLTIGATHPMLNGGTSITTHLESIYAHGSLSAREGSLMDPEERRRKRNILRHLPAVDLSCGVHHISIPAGSYSDDGQTLFLPLLEGGRMMIRLVGGVDSDKGGDVFAVREGVKMIADFTVGSLNLETEGAVKEFPEMEIFDGVQLKTVLSGIINGGIEAHLRPQKQTSSVSTIGPNMFNPLEAYEIDFARSKVNVKIKEYSATLGHRRIIFPTETTLVVEVQESVVDMGFEGTTRCELGWDFQGLSPILQVAAPGQSPEEVGPDNREQASLLINALRQGRLLLNVSSVGGIKITKASTLRDHREGLYDWKFFNALVSPDEESGQRLLDVLHDRRSMEKLLQVAKLLSADVHKILTYTLQQVWRAKEIFDREGVSDPGKAIPLYKMARLLSLFLSGDTSCVDDILPIARRVIDGDGLDTSKVKELIRKHIEHYDEWAAEIDRAVRWAAMLMGPLSVAQPYIEDHVTPLAELDHHALRFRHIPCAKDLYEKILDKPQLPLEPSFSNLVSRVAPYLSFRQVQYLLQVRASTDWQPADLRRLRYVYSIKRKVLEIAESYGGLSFLPQSFLVSVFLGEATRTSLRSVDSAKSKAKTSIAAATLQSLDQKNGGRSTLSRLRRRRVPAIGSSVLDDMSDILEEDDIGEALTPVRPTSSTASFYSSRIPEHLVVDTNGSDKDLNPEYELGDSLLGPQDVAILLQSGLASVMKGSTVVQLNQRMLLDLVCSQPRSFAVAVLAEIGSPGGQGSPRSLTSALMSLLEMDQTAFKTDHQMDMPALLESWLPGMKMPRREDYMAGGRWARQSYYEAIFSVAKSILDDAETYAALKGHLQRVRRTQEKDPIPVPKSELRTDPSTIADIPGIEKQHEAEVRARNLIAEADSVAASLVELLLQDEESAKATDGYKKAVSLYNKAFAACREVLDQDKHAFQLGWFRDFYRRNYDALMLKSMLDNVVEDVDNVRYWLQALHTSALKPSSSNGPIFEIVPPAVSVDKSEDGRQSPDTVGTSDSWEPLNLSAQPQRAPIPPESPDTLFIYPDESTEQELLEAIVQAIIYEPGDRERLLNDPLVRLLIPNPPGEYNFTVVSAMGVVTEGKRGTELETAYRRLKSLRGVDVIRADTGTARSFEYNASKIEEAIEAAQGLKKPFGLLGYSQGCANALMAETLLLSGSPKQQQMLSRPNSGLVCRQLLFSAANGSFHGPAAERKIQRLIVMCEEFFKYQQGYVSRAMASLVLESLNAVLDSSHFHKFMGGANSFLPDGSRAFWREAQHLAHVPTCTLRGVMEAHTTPESLEMISKLLTKQSGSPLHDSQVHVFDAVGYPVYHHNRNGRLLRRCNIGEGAIQRTHHWSPLNEEVEFLRTKKDNDLGTFDCAKDRHVFPWVDVNVRFGFIRYKTTNPNKLAMTHKLEEQE